MISRIIAAITLVSLFAAFITTAIPTHFFPSFSPQAALTLFLSTLLLCGGILALGVFERRSPIFGPVFSHGPKGFGQVALTFDDGPNEPFTSQIIDILEERGIKATFFVVGANCGKFPGALKRLADSGHEIGNHTWSHEVIPLKSPAQIEEEILKASDIIEKYTNCRPKLFRAPHGWRNPWTNRVARKCGCIPVAWSLGVWDTDRPGSEAIVRRTLKGVDDGCVLLVHDGRGVEEHADSSQLVEALPVILDELQRRGLRCMTLSQMMDATPR